MSPLVTVLIDTFNYGRFIEEAIDSVLMQASSRKDIQIIVIDDGSTDDTAERVQKYGNKIEYFYKHNNGQASAFNFGFERARGEYIVLLDSDDYCLPGRIQKIVEEFEKYPETVYVLNKRRFLTDGFSSPKFQKPPIEFHDLALNHKTINLFREASYGTSRTSLRRSLLEKIMPIPEELRIEADLYIHLATVWYGRQSCIDQELTCYRIHRDNFFHNGNGDKLPLQIETMQNALKKAEEAARKSNNFDSKLFDSLSQPYELEIKEKKLSLRIHLGTARRKDVFEFERERYEAGKKIWGVGYRIYRILMMGLSCLFSPRWLAALKNFYWRNNLFRVRNLFFRQ